MTGRRSWMGAFMPSQWNPRTFIPTPMASGAKAEAFEVLR
jgi:hypothetical protein